MSTWEGFKNQDLFKVKYEEVEISPEDRAFFQGIKKPIYVLAIGEDWCPDVYNNLPVMARIAALNPNIQLRIFPRDQHHDLMHRYLFRGQSQSIPAFGSSMGTSRSSPSTLAVARSCCGIGSISSAKTNPAPNCGSTMPRTVGVRCCVSCGKFSAARGVSKMGGARFGASSPALAPISEKRLDPSDALILGWRATSTSEARQMVAIKKVD